MRTYIGLFFVCSSLALTLYGSDNIKNRAKISVESNSTISTNDKAKSLVAEMKGHNSHLDLSRARISGTLEIDISGHNNTIIINHPNMLILTVTGHKCRVTNLWCAGKNSQITVSGSNSRYKEGVGLGYMLFGTLKRTISTIALTGLFAFMLSKTLTTKNANISF